MAFYRETQRRWSEGSLGLNVPVVSPAPWHSYCQRNAIYFTVIYNC